MYSLDRYEFSAEDNLYEKLDAKVGNWLIRSEEVAEQKHQNRMQKLRCKYFKAKAKADAAEEAYYARRSAKTSSLSYDDSAKSRVIDLD